MKNAGRKDMESSREKDLEGYLYEYDKLLEMLDEAMATPEAREAHMIATGGGFISGLNVTVTAEEIVKRAYKILKNDRRCSCKAYAKAAEMQK
jgi:hypothetical protein